MNLLTFTSLDDQEIELKVPESVKEITFSQLLQLQNSDLSDFEIIAILCSVPVDTLYNANYEALNKKAKVYCDLFNHNNAAMDYTIPKKVTITVAGKQKVVKLGRYLNIGPVGAYLDAVAVISEQLNKYAALQAEAAVSLNFTPSYESFGLVVDEFMSIHINNGLWVDKVNRPERVSLAMSAFDVISLAKYFFNTYPAMCVRKPQPVKQFFNKLLSRKPAPTFDFMKGRY
jgi:hypothetical protein